MSSRKPERTPLPWEPDFLKQLTEQELVEWDVMVGGGIPPDRVYSLLSHTHMLGPGNGKHIDPFDKIAADRGWNPLERSEKMTVHFGVKEYVVKRTDPVNFLEAERQAHAAAAQFAGSVAESMRSASASFRARFQALGRRFNRGGIVPSETLAQYIKAEIKAATEPEPELPPVRIVKDGGW